MTIKLKKWYTAGWIFWILFFIVLEGMAIINKQKGDTLSEHLRVWSTLTHKEKASMGYW